MTANRTKAKHQIKAFGRWHCKPIIYSLSYGVQCNQVLHPVFQSLTHMEKFIELIKQSDDEQLNEAFGLFDNSAYFAQNKRLTQKLLYAIRDVLEKELIDRKVIIE